MPLVAATQNDRAMYDAIGAARGHVRVFGLAVGGPTVAARVDHGRWVADCPFCRSAVLTAPLDRFWCPDCGSVAVGGMELAVVWPDDRGEIERLLEGRPASSTRHWFPHETVDDLSDENIAAANADVVVADAAGLADRSSPKWRAAFAAHVEQRRADRNA